MRPSWIRVALNLVAVPLKKTKRRHKTDEMSYEINVETSHPATSEGFLEPPRAEKSKSRKDLPMDPPEGLYP